MAEDEFDSAHAVRPRLYDTMKALLLVVSGVDCGTYTLKGISVISCNRGLCTC